MAHPLEVLSVSWGAGDTVSSVIDLHQFRVVGYAAAFTGSDLLVAQCSFREPRGEAERWWTLEGPTLSVQPDVLFAAPPSWDALVRARFAATKFGAPRTDPHAFKSPGTLHLVVEIRR